MTQEQVEQLLGPLRDRMETDLASERIGMRDVPESCRGWAGTIGDQRSVTVTVQGMEVQHDEQGMVECIGADMGGVDQSVVRPITEWAGWKKGDA